MAKGAQSDELKAAFQTHREQTQGQIERLQIERLEQVFELWGNPHAAYPAPCDDWPVAALGELGYPWRLAAQARS